jgi:predicted  nucleic acid-binding Zn-ribbon protein
MLEYVKGSFVQVANQIKKAKEKIGIADEKIATATASIVANQQALALAIANPAVDQSAIESEIEKLKNLKNTLDGELSLAKKELTAAEDRLTFLKPPA